MDQFFFIDRQLRTEDSDLSSSSTQPLISVTGEPSSLEKLHVDVFESYHYTEKLHKQAAKGETSISENETYLVQKPPETRFKFISTD